MRSSRAASARSFSTRACSNLGGIRAGLLELRARVGELFTRGFEIGRCARRFRLEWLGALRNLTVELAVIGRCSSLELRAKCRDLPALDLTLLTQPLHLRPCLSRLLVQQVGIVEQARDSAVPVGDFGREAVLDAATLLDRRSRRLERAREAGYRRVFLVQKPFDLEPTGGEPFDVAFQLLYFRRALLEILLEPFDALRFLRDQRHDTRGVLAVLIIGERQSSACPTRRRRSR